MTGNLVHWAKAPTFAGDEDRSRAALLSNSVLWIFLISATLYAIFAPIDAEFRIRRFIIIGPFILVLLILKQTLNMGYIRITSYIIVIALWLMFTAAMFFSAGYNNAAFMGYIVVVVCAALILNWRTAIAWGVISVATSAVMLQLGERGYLPVAAQTSTHTDIWIAQTGYIIITTLLLSQATRKIDDSLAKAQHEIHERKRVEAERELFIKELETKNAELERFTYTVSHDLKSPLITIGGYLGFLEKNGNVGKMELFEHDINRIREATKKMEDLLNDLLELSRVGRLVNPPEEIGFSMIVQEAIALVNGQVHEKKVEITVQENLPSVYGDHIRLVEVMQNLLDNAAKYTGDQTHPHIEVGVRQNNGDPIFFVKDNGLGIEEIHYERVFGLFNKLNPNSEGTGVGLALVKRIVETHGGRIWIESAGAGLGTTILFTLPKKGEHP